MDGLEHISKQVVKFVEQHNTRNNKEQREDTPNVKLHHEEETEKYEKIWQMLAASYEQKEKLRRQVEELNKLLEDKTNKITKICAEYDKLMEELFQTNKELDLKEEELILKDEELYQKNEELDQKNKDYELLYEENTQRTKEVLELLQELNQQHEERKETLKSVLHPHQVMPHHEEEQTPFVGFANMQACPPPPQSVHPRPQSLHRDVLPFVSNVHSKQQLSVPDNGIIEWYIKLLEEYNQTYYRNPPPNKLICRVYRKNGFCTNELCIYSHEDLKRHANDNNGYNLCFCMAGFNDKCLHNEHGQCSKNHIGRGLPGDLPNPPEGYHVIMSQGHLFLMENEK
uniref:C3H1-type domain-containing protein n=1 Tax=viral metagenome TaxID=1070528 RepID=A0A6C0H7Z2_9ZZZZ